MSILDTAKDLFLLKALSLYNQKKATNHNHVLSLLKKKVNIHCAEEMLMAANN